MSVIRLPKTLRWICLSSLLLLLVMTLYRFLVYSMFTGVLGTAPLLAFWYGLRFDARVIAIVSLFIFLIGLWPGLHYFKWAPGKIAGLVLYGIFAVTLTLLCMADVGYLYKFNSRLQGSLLFDFAKHSEKWALFGSGAYWWLIFFVALIIIAGVLFFIKYVHQKISKNKRSSSRGRTAWQIAFVVVCIALIYGNAGVVPLSESLVESRIGQAGATLAVDPFTLLVNTIPSKSHADE